nr:DNA polymerase III subunit alpha [Alphaproteobacteria bacterium]
MAAAIRSSKKAPQSERAPGTGLRASPGFVHLKVHSSYSLLEGALPIKKLAELALNMQMPALALTDTSNLFGVLEFCEAFAKQGLQPIAGVSLTLKFSDASTGDEALSSQPPGAPRLQAGDAGRVTLLAANDDGYANLLKIVSSAHLQSPSNEAPHTSLDVLRDLSAGLIALSGGTDGPIDTALQDGRQSVASERLAALHAIFGDRLYVEIQRHGGRGATGQEAALLALAYEAGLPIVATNEVYFEAREDYEAHDALLCIADGRYVVEDDRRRVTPDHYFKSAEEMAALFSDLPEALENTIEIARRCSTRSPSRKPILPRFVASKSGQKAADQLAAEAAELKRQAHEGLKDRLASNALADGFTVKDYEERLEFELDIITGMKFPGYFLIVADFIKWAKSHAIPVGPGRGSGAGSVVAWALTITDLDPLRFGLLFERFLNPERVSMPDFDIDFCQDRRDEVIQYVQDKYGADRVAQIITHGKLQARAVLRDVGRVLQMPYGQVDRLCKLVPN